MNGRRERLFRAAIDILHATRLFRLAPLVARPRGVIFLLHRVRPRMPAEFAPNAHLEVTPEFLDRVIGGVARAGFDLVDLDDAARRLAAGQAKPFAVFTLDDGYRDNAVHAAPVFRRHACPYTIYVPSDFAEGTGELWWLVLEQAIAGSDRVSTEIAGAAFELPCATPDEKRAAFDTLYWELRRVGEAEQRRAARRLAMAAGIEMSALCRAHIMSWDELGALAADPLCTIAAHGVRHHALAKLAADEAREEIRVGADRLAERMWRRPRHFAYPYGDAGSAGPRDFAAAREAGFDTAVTARPGVLYGAHGGHMTALPRVMLREGYPAERYADVFLSGAPTLLYNRGRLVPI